MHHHLYIQYTCLSDRMWSYYIQSGGDVPKWQVLGKTVNHMVAAVAAVVNVHHPFQCEDIERNSIEKGSTWPTVKMLGTRKKKTLDTVRSPNFWDTHSLFRVSSSRHDRNRFVNGESCDEGVINTAKKKKKTRTMMQIMCSCRPHHVN